jgi:predicted O-methyltransferase YrrM
MTVTAPASSSQERFHVDQAHRERARGALPFAASPELDELVRDAYTAGARRDIDRTPNPYALLPDTLAFLEELLDRLKPRTMVEFGSGASTRVFARWAAANGSRLVSVEHDRGWVDEVRKGLSDEQRAAVDLIHAPLRLARRGPRQFFTYRGLDGLGDAIGRAGLLLLDGPHMSGREVVLRATLAHATAGAIAVIDDFRHYAVREMLIGTPPAVAACFEGAAVDENSHGLYVLRCRRTPPAAPFPVPGVRSIVQSYWRCLLDYRQHGTGE